MAHTLCRCGHTYDVEFESVELALIHACVKGGLHVHGIGVGDIARMRIQCIGNRHQHTVLGVGGRLRQFMLCHGRRVGERVHRLLHVAAHRGLKLIRIRHRPKSSGSCLQRTTVCSIGRTRVGVLHTLHI